MTLPDQGQMLSDQGQALRVHHRMTIARLAQVHGVSRRTIRYYERIGLLRPRQIGCELLYSARDEVRLQIVLMGRRMGLSLMQIVQLIEQPGCCVRSGEDEEARVLARLQGPRGTNWQRDDGDRAVSAAIPD